MQSTQTMAELIEKASRGEFGEVSVEGQDFAAAVQALASELGDPSLSGEPSTHPHTRHVLYLPSWLDGLAESKDLRSCAVAAAWWHRDGAIVYVVSRKELDERDVAHGQRMCAGVRREFDGADDPRAMVAAAEFAEVSGQLDLAEQYCLLALANAESRLGTSHVDLIPVLNPLSRIYLMSGDMAESLTAMSRCTAILDACSAPQAVGYHQACAALKELTQHAGHDVDRRTAVIAQVFPRC